ncbi:transglycosylase family protein [Streptomyces sp. NPDC060194]|uniref:transglycosylase family protein n=1 Tax=Streptomyces sp. NPDC060194 TaxID=3347069 RepID=UPI003658C6D4
MTGSAVALPLLGATGAHAADAGTWDKVAMCETGGLWSADLGNGLHGGLQFSPETWARYGGLAYAPSADLASRSQQIAVAEKVLEAEGPGAWPGCADISGLAKAAGGSDERPQVDPGASASPAETAAERKAEKREKRGGRDDEREPTGSKSPRPAASASDETSNDPVPRGGADVTTGEATPSASGSGKHRGRPAEEAGEALAGRESEDGAVEELAGPAPDDARADEEHASRGTDATRDEDLAAGRYTVREGDNLWTLARSHEVEGGWSALYEANRESVGEDPDLILPGQSLDFGVKQEAGQKSGAESAE